MKGYINFIILILIGWFDRIYFKNYIKKRKKNEQKR